MVNRRSVCLLLLLLMVAQLVLGGGSAHAAPPASGPTTHVVRRGENLSLIARRYGVSIRAIVRANGLRNPNFIYAGQRLTIPSAGGSPPPAPGGRRHVVRRGETLTTIAWRYRVSVWAIVRANGLRNPNVIYAGQRLLIPGGGSTPAPSPAPPSSGAKSIVVKLSTQTLAAYQGGAVVYTARVSTGTARYPTPVGNFRIRRKYRTQTMVGPGYYLPNVPHVMYFYGGYALHGTYWHNNFGTPMSHGCVNLSQPDAAWLYAWAPIGTPVVVTR